MLKIVESQTAASLTPIEISTVEGILKTIMTNDPRPTKRPPLILNEKLPRDKLKFLLSKVSAVLLHETTLLEIEPPIIIFGDTHGQFGDLLDIIDTIGQLPKQRYLFMGDYVDRGEMSIELMSFLFALKIRYPDHIYLLRGNHESSEVNAEYGFKLDCLRDYDIAIWDMFQESFKCLPLVALLGKEILCMHGGLSPTLTSVDDIRRIPRPLDIPEEGWVCDVLWADPIPPKEHHHADKSPQPVCCSFSPNKSRGTSVWYGTEAIDEFLKKNDLDLIVRGHEMVEPGFEFSTNKKVVTIFSAPNYCQHSNDASVLVVDVELRCYIWVFKFPNAVAPTCPLPLMNIVTNAAQELWNEVTLRLKHGKTEEGKAQVEMETVGGVKEEKKPITA